LWNGEASHTVPGASHTDLRQAVPQPGITKRLLGSLEYA